MATEATRRARPSLSALLAILLALIAGLAAPPLVVEPAAPAPAAVSVSAEATWPGEAPAPADFTEPVAAPIDAVDRVPGVIGAERALCTQLAGAVRAARAPPTASA
jgi:hypothetical protein